MVLFRKAKKIEVPGIPPVLVSLGMVELAIDC